MKLVALFGLLIIGSFALTGCGEDSAKGAADISKEMPKGDPKVPDEPELPGGIPRGDKK